MEWMNWTGNMDEPETMEKMEWKNYLLKSPLGSCNLFRSKTQKGKLLLIELISPNN